MPELPDSANDPDLQGGLPLSEILSLEAGERALALTALPTDGPGLALGTRAGVVKRVNPEVLGRDEWEVIGLKDGDEVVGAVELRTGEEELCFISSDAQLLHFPAGGVRPPGPDRRRHGRHQARHGPARGVLRCLRPGRCCRGDGLGLLDRPARHRGGIAQGRAVQRVPRQGPRDRRRPQPPVPQGRGHLVTAWAGLGRPGPPRPAVRRSTCPSRPAGATGPAHPHPSPSPPSPPPSRRRSRHPARCGRLRSMSVRRRAALATADPAPRAHPRRVLGRLASEDDGRGDSPKRSWRSPRRS